VNKLQIYNPRDRALVAAADATLAGGMVLARPFRRRRKPAKPERILLLRLERIGDLLMALPGIAAVRRAAPSATIDLVVGSWNEQLARAIPSVNNIETLDAGWLTRENTEATKGSKDAKTNGGLLSMLRRAAGWRHRHYDLAINFEPDIRSNLLLATAGPSWTAGYSSAGGGSLLDEALEYDPTAHTSDNARRLVATVFGAVLDETAGPLLAIPGDAYRRGQAMLGTSARPRVAMHISGGRPVKQWDPQRFGDVAKRLVATRGATIVLTGSPADRPLVEPVLATLPRRSVVDAANGLDLLTLAAVLSESDLCITGDTGPMHLAFAVGLPIVAVFGPSEPRRYAPRGPLDRVVRVDLPCSPCNRIRLPPARCQGKIPDCLALVSSGSVFDAAIGVLDQCQPRTRAHNASA
jgi:ADP-heptose:LPS heptosyltransferase